MRRRSALLSLPKTQNRLHIPRRTSKTRSKSRKVQSTENVKELQQNHQNTLTSHDLRPPTQPPLSHPPTDKHIHSSISIPSPIVQHLTTLFFSHVNNQSFPVLHERSFKRQLALSKISPPLLYAICAASAVFSTHPSILQLSIQPLPDPTDSPPPPTPSPPTPGQSWAQLARKALHPDSHHTFSLDGVQATSILALFELARGNGRTAWLDLAAASRTAQLLGFYDETPRACSSSSSSSRKGEEEEEEEEEEEVERELRRRIVWSIFSIEAVLGCGPHSASMVGSASSGVRRSVLLDVLLPMRGRLSSSSSSSSSLSSSSSSSSSQGDGGEGNRIVEIGAGAGAGADGGGGLASGEREGIDHQHVPRAFLDGGRIVHNPASVGVEPFLLRAFDIWSKVNAFVEDKKRRCRLNVGLNSAVGGGGERPRGGGGGGGGGNGVGGVSAAASLGEHFVAGKDRDELRDWHANSDFARLSLLINAWSMHLPVAFLFNAQVIETLNKDQLSMYYTMHCLNHLGQI
ncbi:hypothetical protein T439DRAFT_20430 [Meredithblackwellia eburnea MCA 4105]